jgi:membrane associated rhomboid family serine protease
MVPMSSSVKRPRHLMDPANPVRPTNDASLTTVQRWVMSMLAATTVFHLSVGLVIAAAVVDARTGQVGLLVIAGVCGVLGLVGAFLIHGRSPVTPWVLLGVVPAVVGALVVL